MAQTIATAYVQILPSTDGMKKNLKSALTGAVKDSTGGVSAALSGALGTAAKAGVAAMGAATGAVAAFTKSSVSAGMSFDTAMSQVAATMGLTMDEMQTQVGATDLAWGSFSGNLREYAMEMGKNTTFSATEAAEALNYMALAGYDVQTSMDMLPNVMNLAAAGGFDLARASDMVTDTQTAFGISLERTSQMVDEMAKAASTGNTSVEQLGDAFLVVGGLTQELNGGLVYMSDGTTQAVDGVQELEIALTAMANAGVKGTEAGTHMRNMLLKLSSPTDDGVAAMEAMGVAVFDTEGKMRSLVDIFGDMSVAMDSMTQEQKIQAISDLFNTRDIASAEALLNAVSQDWDAIGQSILAADGAAQQMADTQLDNLAGDITLFNSALEITKVTLADQLNPLLRNLVQAGTEALGPVTDKLQEYFSRPETVEKMNQLVDAIMRIVDAILNNLDPIMDTTIGIINGIADALVFVANHFEGVTTAIGVVIGAFAGLKALNLVSGIASVVSTLGGAVGAVGGVGTAIGALVNPVTLAVAGVAAAAIAIVTHWDDIKEGALIAWEGIKSAWSTVGEFFGGVWENIQGAFANAGSWFGQKFESAKQAAHNAWSNTTTFFANVRDGIYKVFENAPSNFMTIGANLMRGLANGISNLASTVVEGAKSVASRIANAVTNFFNIGSPSKLFYDYGAFLDEGLANGIADRTQTAVSAMRGMASSVADAVGTDYNDVSLARSVSQDIAAGGGMTPVLAAPEPAGQGGLEDLVTAIYQRIQNMGVYIDGNTLVGHIAPGLNNEFGVTTWRERREAAYA